MAYRKLEVITKAITIADIKEQKPEGLRRLNSYYEGIASGEVINRTKKSTLNTYYRDRLDTKEGVEDVIKELETEYNTLKDMVIANNYNVSNSILISLGSKEQLLKDAKAEIENF